MPRRLSHWCCLLWATLWLGVIAPGHERGIVKVPGTGCSAAATDDTGAAKDACCRKPSGGGGGGGGGAEAPDTPDEDPAKRCAICKLNASLTLPPVALLAPGLCDLLGELEPLPLTPPTTVERNAVYLGRAPPFSMSA